MHTSITFKEKYCEKFGIDPTDFADSLFWKSVRWYWKPIAALIKAIAPSYFKPDYEFIKSIAFCESFRDIKGEIASYHWECSTSRFLRRRFHIRVSSKRVARLGRRLLNSQN